MTKRLLCNVVTVSLVVIAAAGCREAGSKTNAASEQAKATAAALVVPVPVLTAGEGGTGGEFVVTGTLDAVRAAPLTVEVGGTVRKIHVDVGDRVVQGQALATMDTKDRQLSLQQAEAGLAAAQVQYETAHKNWQRFSTLEAGGSISKADFEQAEMGYKAAKAQLAQARAQERLVRNMVEDGVLRAPFDGQITMRVAQVGGYINPMTHPVMFTLVDASRLKATLNIPEMRAALVKPGDLVTIRVPASERSFSTRIEVLTDVVDPMTRNRAALAWIDNPGPELVPSGSYFEARVVSEALKGRIVLPSSAIREDTGGGTTVYVVDGGVAKMRRVQGRFLADHADFVIDSGLQRGDLVVSESSMVRDGQAVAPIKEAAR